MVTFSEWLKSEGLDDEFLAEALSRRGFLVGAAAAGLGASLMGRDAEAAISAVPDVSAGSQSDKSFSKELAVELAPMMGLNPDKVRAMSDFDAWSLQMKKIRRVEDEMRRRTNARMRGAHNMGNKEWPMWYIKFGTHYGWKAPRPPEVR